MLTVLLVPSVEVTVADACHGQFLLCWTGLRYNPHSQVSSAFLSFQGKGVRAFVRIVLRLLLNELLR